MSFIGLISKTVVAGFSIASVGITSSLVSSVPAFRLTGDASTQPLQVTEREASPPNTTQTTTAKETRHCRVLLESTSPAEPAKEKNQQILACVDSKHEDLEGSNLQEKEKWYLYDKNKKTLEEIAGFFTNNVQGWKWRWGGWGWDWLFLPFAKQDSDFWKENEWKPYKRWEDKYILRIGSAETFSLLDSSTKKLPNSFYQALSRDYLTPCRYYTEIGCQSFWLDKKDLTELSTIKSNQQKICLTRTGQTTTWEAETNCPVKAK